MADTKTSALTSYTTPLAADLIPIVDTANSTLKKVTIPNLLQSANLPVGLTNHNSAAQSQITVAGTHYYVTNSSLALPNPTMGGMQVGSVYKWTVAMTKTAAGTGTFLIDIYRGTAGSTADTRDVAQTIGTQTAAVDNVTIDVQVVVTATGATGSYFWSIVPNNKAVTATGFGVATGTAAYTSGTVSSVAMNTAGIVFGLGFSSTTGTPTIVVPFVHAQAFNLS